MLFFFQCIQLLRYLPVPLLGHGKLIMADGSYYEGEFQNGEIEGHGFRYYSSSGKWLMPRTIKYPMPRSF